MPWEARTAFGEIRPGTRLCIYETPQIHGEPRPVLLGSHPLKIELNDQWIDAEVTEATGDRAIIEFADGKKYEMSVLEPGEFDSSIRLQGMYSNDWVIRAEV